MAFHENIKKILFIGLVWPEPQSTAAGSRMLQLLLFFEELGCEITFASAAEKTKFSMDLEVLGIREVSILLNDSSFDAFVTDLLPNVVVFDRFLIEEQFGWRVAEQCPNAMRILDTEDLHSLRQVREGCFKKNIPFSMEAWKAHDATKREMASIYRSDLSLIISQTEMKLLNALGIPETLLHYLPFLMLPITDTKANQWPDFYDRKDFVFMGNGKHNPNIDAIRWLKKGIWPLIRQQLPKTNLYIYGGHLPQSITQMHQPKEGFYVMGWIEDANIVMQQARVNLASLRFGAGLKGKVVQALQNGTPTVITTIGAEGIFDTDHKYSVADTPEAFAQAAIEIYGDENKWEIWQKDGIRINNSRFDKNIHAPLFTTRLQNLFTSLKPHRDQNFIGAMLLHHTTASTKYMGKWIETKNRK